MLTLSQTVAGSWVITIPNPEERHWSTQLAEFSTDSATVGSPVHAAMERGAAQTVTGLDAATEESEGILVTSHDEEARNRMLALVLSLCDDETTVESR